MGHGKDGQRILDDGIAAQDGDFNLSQISRKWATLVQKQFPPSKWTGTGRGTFLKLAMERGQAKNYRKSNLAIQQEKGNTAI
jgi:hypothetical protein